MIYTDDVDKNTGQSVHTNNKSINKTRAVAQTTPCNKPRKALNAQQVIEIS